MQFTQTIVDALSLLFIFCFLILQEWLATQVRTLLALPFQIMGPLGTPALGHCNRFLVLATTHAVVVLIPLEQQLDSLRQICHAFAFRRNLAFWVVPLRAHQALNPSLAVTLV
jgi:hypothetical protein